MKSEFWALVPSFPLCGTNGTMAVAGSEGTGPASISCDGSTLDAGLVRIGPCGTLLPLEVFMIVSF